MQNQILSTSKCREFKSLLGEPQLHQTKGHSKNGFFWEILNIVKGNNPTSIKVLSASLVSWPFDVLKIRPIAEICRNKLRSQIQMSPMMLVRV